MLQLYMVNLYIYVDLQFAVGTCCGLLSATEPHIHFHLDPEHFGDATSCDEAKPSIEVVAHKSVEAVHFFF